MNNTSQPHPGLMDNLSGALDIMLGRASGMAKIDHSATGFWMSFWGIVLMVLIDASALSLVYNVSPTAANEAGVSKSVYMVVRLCIAVLGYGASFLALFLLCRTGEEQNRFADAVIVNNWAAPILSLGFLPLIWMSTLATSAAGEGSPPSGFVLLILTSWVIVTIAGVRILRTTLQVDLLKAVLFFAVTSGVSIFISEGFQSLSGL